MDLVISMVKCQGRLSDGLITEKNEQKQRFPRYEKLTKKEKKIENAK